MVPVLLHRRCCHCHGSGGQARVASGHNVRVRCVLDGKEDAFSSAACHAREATTFPDVERGMKFVVGWFFII